MQKIDNCEFFGAFHVRNKTGCKNCKMMVLENQQPHKPGCAADAPLDKMGLAYFCPLCRVRIGFVPQKDGEELITRALERDLLGGM